MEAQKSKIEQVTRRIENGRLAYYKRAATAEYWDTVWSEQSVDQLYADSEKGELGYYQEIFPKYLPKTGPILEAGCGLAQFVIALRVLGYDAQGIDYGQQTVTRVKKRFPDLPVKQGDVTQIKIEDDHYAAYISLGVMEHIYSGPDPFLVEAKRVLKPGGIALISVPYLNAIRRLKAFLGLFHEDVTGLEFYQYAYHPKEFSKILGAHRFEVLELFQYAGYKGIKDEVPFLSRMFEWPQGWRLKKFLMNWNWANRHLGHMMMYVARIRK